MAITGHPVRYMLLSPGFQHPLLVFIYPDHLLRGEQVGIRFTDNLIRRPGLLVVCPLVDKIAILYGNRDRGIFESQPEPLFTLPQRLLRLIAQHGLAYIFSYFFECFDALKSKTPFSTII